MTQLFVVWSASASDYVEELALPDPTIEAVRDAGGAIEVAVAAHVFPAPVYKPSALDGFGPHSKFRPDCTSCAHGWTQLKGGGVTPRPELVSRVFAYRALAPDITVAYIPYT